MSEADATGSSGSVAQDLVIRQVANVATASLIARRGAMALVVQRVDERFGLRLPSTPSIASGGTVSALWAGYQQFLVRHDTTRGPEFERLLRDAVGASASVSDLTDAREQFRIEGPGARNHLAHGLPIDMHPSMFKVGDVALTQWAHYGVHVWRSDHDTYELLVASSYAEGFAEILGVR